MDGELKNVAPCCRPLLINWLPWICLALVRFPRSFIIYNKDDIGILWKVGLWVIWNNSQFYKTFAMKEFTELCWCAKLLKVKTPIQSGMYIETKPFQWCKKHVSSRNSNFSLGLAALPQANALSIPTHTFTECVYCTYFIFLCCFGYVCQGLCFTKDN